MKSGRLNSEELYEDFGHEELELDQYLDRRRAAERRSQRFFFKSCLYRSTEHGARSIPKGFTNTNRSSSGKGVSEGSANCQLNLGVLEFSSILTEKNWGLFPHTLLMPFCRREWKMASTFRKIVKNVANFHRYTEGISEGRKGFRVLRYQIWVAKIVKILNSAKNPKKGLKVFLIARVRTYVDFQLKCSLFLT